MSRNKIAIIFVLLTSAILVTDSMKLIDTIQMEANEIPPMIKFVFKCVRSAEALISLLNKQKSPVKSDSRSIKNFSFDPLNPSGRGLNKTSSKNETDTTLPETTTELSKPDTTVEPKVEEDSKAPEDENTEDEAEAPEDENAEDEAEAPEDENAEDEAEAPEDENAEDEAEAPEDENAEDEAEAPENEAEAPEDENAEDEAEAPEDENAEDEAEAPENKIAEDETDTEVPSTTLSPE